MMPYGLKALIEFWLDCLESLELMILKGETVSSLMQIEFLRSWSPEDGVLFFIKLQTFFISGDVCSTVSLSPILLFTLVPFAACVLPPAALRSELLFLKAASCMSLRGKNGVLLCSMCVRCDMACA